MKNKLLFAATVFVTALVAAFSIPAFADDSSGSQAVHEPGDTLLKSSFPLDQEPVRLKRKGYVYAGPFRFYVNDYDSTFVLESAAFSEGRIVRKELSEGSFVYEPHFFIKDHLGSVRAVVKADGEILQQNDYQPYGEKIIADGLASGENDYLYCGKEFQSFFDLPFYDSGARFQRNDGNDWKDIVIGLALCVESARPESRTIFCHS